MHCGEHKIGLDLCIYYFKKSATLYMTPDNDMFAY